MVHTSIINFGSRLVVLAVLRSVVPFSHIKPAQLARILSHLTAESWSVRYLGLNTTQKERELLGRNKQVISTAKCRRSAQHPLAFGASFNEQQHNREGDELQVLASSKRHKTLLWSGFTGWECNSQHLKAY